MGLPGLFGQFLSETRQIKPTTTTCERCSRIPKPIAWMHVGNRYLGSLTLVEAVRVGRMDRFEDDLEVLGSGVAV